MATNPAINTLSGTSLSRPSASVFYAGLQYYAGDSGTVTRCDGVSWGYEARVTASPPSESLTIFAGSTSTTWAPGASYAPFVTAASECRVTKDMTAKREARIHVRASVTTGSSSVTVKLVDVDNTQDMTGVVVINSGTISTKSSLWTQLNPATYGYTTCAFEVQGIEGGVGDGLNVWRLDVELR